MAEQARPSDESARCEGGEGGTEGGALSDRAEWEASGRPDALLLWLRALATLSSDLGVVLGEPKAGEEMLAAVESRGDPLHAGMEPARALSSRPASGGVGRSDSGSGGVSA